MAIEDYIDGVVNVITFFTKESIFIFILIIIGVVILVISAKNWLENPANQGKF